jgi:catechol 2,3-dioxygenase-like lactoylglutathione lyase family enzyme
MTPVIHRIVAATYVRDIETSRAFYEVLGFRELRSGRGASSAWSALRQGPHAILLATSRPPLEIPHLPLLFYFFFADLNSVLSALDTAGVQKVHLGHPPHAPGGEVKVIDPDGNTVLLGQEERAASQPPVTDEDGQSSFSLLKEAAAAVQARGGTTVTCQVSRAGRTCSEAAEVKLADSAGNAAWACLPHADEILVTVPGSFIASEDAGMAAFLSPGR